MDKALSYSSSFFVSLLKYILFYYGNGILLQLVELNRGT
jgi:hypothetical protein